MRPHTSQIGRAAALAALASLGLASGGSAQTEPEAAEGRRPATLVGQVVNAMTGRPVEGAVVTLVGSGFGAITDTTGNFRIPQTWAGRDTIEVRFIGYEPSRTAVDLAPDETSRVTLLLSQTVVRVADLTVEVRQSRKARELQGFVERMEKGFGTFFTPRDIRNRNPRLPSDLLRGMPGVQVGRIEHGRAPVYFGRGQRLGCKPAIFVDGVHQAGLDLDDIPPEELGAVEVYKGITDTPMEFMRASDCGAIVIWTPDSVDFMDWAYELPRDPFDD